MVSGGLRVGETSGKAEKGDPLMVSYLINCDKTF